MGDFGGAIGGAIFGVMVYPPLGPLALPVWLLESLLIVLSGHGGGMVFEFCCPGVEMFAFLADSGEGKAPILASSSSLKESMFSG